MSNIIIGKTYHHKGIKVVLEKFIDFKKGIVRNIITKDVEVVDLSSLESTNVAPEVEADINIDSLPDKDWAVAQWRFSIIEPIINADRSGEQVLNRTQWIKQIAKEHKIGYVTIYRWLNDYASSGLVSSLVPQKRLGGKGQSRLTPEVDLIINETIKDFYLTSQNRSQKQTAFEVLRRCIAAGIEPPHENTIRNRITGFSQEEKLKKRAGRVLTEQRVAPVPGKFSLANRPLEVVQIDHTLLDIILVSEEDREPMGRPWITMGIDVFSRMVTGFYISMDPPGALGSGICISNSILEKDQIVEKYELKSEWPVFGVMEAIHMDNAKEFRGSTLAKACKEYSISINWRPVNKPNWGAHIERLLGTLSKEIHALPGTTFSSPKYRQNYNSTEKATMTLYELEKWLHTLVVDVYHHKLHKGIGTSPILRYTEGIFGSKNIDGTGVPFFKVDHEKVRLDFLPFFERKIRRTGVTIDHINYYHDVFKKYLYDSFSFRGDGFVKTHGYKKYTFKRDPRDISKIYFLDPESNKYLPIFYADASKPSISIWEHREALKYAKKQNPKSDINQNMIFDAYDRLREIEDQAKKSKRKAKKESRVRKVREFESPSEKQQSKVPNLSTPPEIDLSTIKPFDTDEFI